MSKLPQDAELAFEQARALYTPSPERLAQVQARIARAVESGASASVDVPQALFVPSSRALRQRRYRLPYWMLLGAFAVVLGAQITSRLREVALPAEAPATAEVAASPQPEVLEAPKAVLAPAALSDVPIEPEGEPLETTLPESSQASVARPRNAEKPKRTQTAQAPAPAALAKQAEDPFGAAFDFPPPAAPVEAAEPQPRPHAEQNAAGERSSFAKASGAAVPTARLAEEVTLIAQAKKAIVRGELERAQLLLNQHRRDFPGGQLLAERVALEVHLRCKAGDVAGAQQGLKELALLAPDSLLLRNATQKCGE